MDKKALKNYIDAYVNLPERVQDGINNCTKAEFNFPKDHPDNGMFLLVTYDVRRKKVTRIFYNEDEMHNDPDFDVELLFD